MTWPDGDPNDGLTVVHSDVLTSIEQQFRDLAEQCVYATRLVTMADGPGLDDVARHAVGDAVAAAIRAENGLVDVADAIGQARFVFDASERAVQSMVSALSGQVAALLGFVGVPVLGIAALALAGPALGIAARIAQQPLAVRERFGTLAQAGANDVARQLGTPAGVAALGWLMSNAGSFLAGMVRVPPPLAVALGESGTGLLTVDRLAIDATLIAAAGGASGVAAVRVAAQPLAPSGGSESRQVPAVAATSTVQPVTAPTTQAERSSRVPDGSGAQIRIERYVGENGPYAEVYIAGTDMDAPPGGENAWDITSNFALVGGLPSSSLQALDLALIDAGVTPDMPVHFTGHSQGALIAVTAAECGRWNTAGLLAIGGPVGGVPVTGSYPAFIVEHTDDPVTRLGGEHDLSQTRATIVETQAYPDGAPEIFAAHHLEQYQQSIRDLDATEDWIIRRTADRFPSVVAEGVVSVYRGERILDGGGDDSGGRGRATR